MMFGFDDFLLIVTLAFSIGVMILFTVKRLLNKAKKEVMDYFHMIDRMYRAEMNIKLLQTRVASLEEGGEE